MVVPRKLRTAADTAVDFEIKDTGRLTAYTLLKLARGAAVAGPRNLHAALLPVCGATPLVSRHGTEHCCCYETEMIYNLLVKEAARQTLLPLRPHSSLDRSVTPCSWLPFLPSLPTYLEGDVSVHVEVLLL